MGEGERYVCADLSLVAARGVRSSSESSEMTSMSYIAEGETTTEGSSSVGIRKGDRTRPGDRRGDVDLAFGETMYEGDECARIIGGAIMGALADEEREWERLKGERLRGDD